MAGPQYMLGEEVGVMCVTSLPMYDLPEVRLALDALWVLFKGFG